MSEEEIIDTANVSSVRDSDTDSDCSSSLSNDWTTGDDEFLIEITDEIDSILKESNDTTFQTEFVTTDAFAAQDPIKHKRISFGCLALDYITDKGISARGITEIFGAAGSGKTQICLQLSLMVQLPEEFGGFNKSAVYICTENLFPAERLHELSEKFIRKYSFFNINFEDNIFIKHVSDAKNLLNCISVDLLDLLTKRNIGLIVIDSVAGIYRSFTNFIDRAASMKEFAFMLLQISDKYGCAVLCTNQVTAVINESLVSNETSVPCLGLGWANLITTRIEITKTENSQPDPSNNTRAFVRKMSIHVAPGLLERYSEFLITSDGLGDTT